ncbi:MAG TPA: polymer-forming cytoskeletal protein [Gemmatimonadales bacterium]|nr:polymer-forming cytoskeletal protein [Gemmatimonadales bacterium]
MRAPSRVLAVAALFGLLAPRVASAGTLSDPTGSHAVELVHGFWSVVADVAGQPGDADDQQAPHPPPQAIPPGSKNEPPVALDELSKPTAIETRLREALRRHDGGIRVTVTNGAARMGDFSIGSNETVPGHLLVVQGTADIYGKLLGNLVTVEGDVVIHPGGVVSGDILTLGGEVRDEGGEIGGEVRTFRTSNVLETPLPAAAAPPPSAIETVFRRMAGVLGVFLTLGALGFGLVMFGRSNLEVVSDTVSHSFGRAFATGLLGQLLLLPTFGMLVVGLILSVVGIVLLPFAVVVYALLVIVGAVGGYLAVAHAMGETYTRRRLALGAMIGSPNSYRYLLVGLGALAAFWAAWSIFGWVPVAGDLIRGAAILVTWLLATAGFGAALLSRAGVRENFAGRLLPPEALTDEYLWATPQFGVTAAKRPGSRTPTRGL